MMNFEESILLQKVLVINCFSGPKEHNNVSSEDNMPFLS
jgi:hypothetical protein